MLLANSKLNGTLTADTLLLEMDERSAQRILPYVKPDYLVCTNLQRDSMKRNAHVEFIFDFLNRNIPEKTVVISNADDLVSSQLVPENKHIYFGVALLDGEVPTNDSLVSDIVNCPNCGTRLQFSFRHYNHIGQATCPNCGFCNAKADFQVKKVENCTATIQHHDTTEIYPIPNDRITDIYNSAAVITFLRTYGISQQQVADCLKGSEIVKSRYDTLTSFILRLPKDKIPLPAPQRVTLSEKNSAKKQSFSFWKTSMTAAAPLKTSLGFMKPTSNF